MCQINICVDFIFIIAFDNTAPISSNNYHSAPQKKVGFFDKVGGFLNTAKEKAQETAHKVGEKIKEMELGDKIKDNGAKAFAAVKTTGSIVVEKGKEVYVNFAIINP